MRRILILFFIGICILAAPYAVHADTVYLTNGNTLEGRVRYENGRVIVEQSAGEVILDKSKVEHVEKSRTALDDFDDRTRALERKEKPSAQDWGDLAQFAALKKLRNQALQSWAKALEADPNFEPAHKALGHVKYEGRWMSPEDANGARGLVRHDGAWITPEAQADIQRMQVEASAERARAESERLQLQRQERAQREAYEERARQDTRYNPYPYVFFSSVRRFHGHGHGHGRMRDYEKVPEPKDVSPVPAPYVPLVRRPPAPYKPTTPIVRYELLKK